MAKIIGKNIIVSGNATSINVNSGGAVNIPNGGITTALVQNGITLNGNPSANNKLTLTGNGFIESDSPSTNNYRLLMGYNSLGNLLVADGQFDENTTMRTVRGYIQGNGATISGTGFSVIRNAAGNYTINFNTSFHDDPAVQVTIVQTGSAAFPIIVALSPSSFQVELNAGGGPLSDSNFTFTARGALF